MDIAAELRRAREAAGLSQAALARRAGTSQATISAYESGRKRPSLETFERLLAVAGAGLRVESADARLARAGRTLVDVLALAEALPVRHERTLRYPRVPAARRAA